MVAGRRSFATSWGGLASIAGWKVGDTVPVAPIAKSRLRRGRTGADHGAGAAAISTITGLPMASATLLRKGAAGDVRYRRRLRTRRQG